MSSRWRSTTSGAPAALEAARVAAQQRLDGFAQRAVAAGTPIAPGQALSAFPARCLPLDHAAIAWAHATGVPAPATPTGLGAELVVTTEGIAYMTFPVPYVWWRRWPDVQCSRAAIGRRRWWQDSAPLFVVDRVPPFEGRAFDIPLAAANAFMDLAVQRGAVLPPAPS